MEYRLARTYEEQGYKIIADSIREEGGKLYADTRCACYKCGGSGRIPHFAHIDGGVCFLCGGNGASYKAHCRIYTQTEREKMDLAAERKREKKLEQEKAAAGAKIQAWKDKYNISDGNIYIVAGCNTYDIKDTLKAQGAKFYTGLGWFFGTGTAPAEKDADYPEGAFLFHTTLDSLMYFNEVGGGPYFLDGALDELKRAILEETKKNNKDKFTSQHYGEIGQRIRQAEAKYLDAKCINSEWGSSFLYTFEMNGNIFTWFTKSLIDESIKAGDEIFLSGTIKNHTEYNGILQTQLSRCIVKKRGE